MSRTIRLAALTVAALATVAVAHPAVASTATATMSVSATVLSACVVGATPLAFGNYTGAVSNQTANVAVTCTNGTSYTVALNNGTGSGATAALRQMTGPASATLGYAIYSDSARSVVWGSTTGTNTVAGTGTGLLQTITAYGQIPASQAPSPGAYTDTVTVTLTY
jgi:spore coat protein U-like protein